MLILGTNFTINLFFFVNRKLRKDIGLSQFVWSTELTLGPLNYGLRL